MKIKSEKMNIPKNPTKRHADLNNDGGNIITKLKNFILNKLLRDFSVEYRIIYLFLAAVLGLLLFGYTYYYLSTCTFSLCKKFGDLTHNSLSLLVLGLPTFFVLWVFRTHDVQRQIDNNTFFECTHLLASNEKKVSKKIALEQLVYLKQKNSIYQKRIDSLTRGISLEEATLNFAQLYDINLSGAILINAYLIGTNLRSANLTYAYLNGADLNYAYLHNANLTEAKLYGANLEKAEHYNTATFTGAIYDKNTKFPPGFDPQKAGCIKDPAP